MYFDFILQVLADSVGIPCRLIKGQQYTGSDDVAMNFVRIHGARLLQYKCFCFLIRAIHNPVIYKC